MPVTPASGEVSIDSGNTDTGNPGARGVAGTGFSRSASWVLQILPWARGADFYRTAKGRPRVVRADYFRKVQ